MRCVVFRPGQGYFLLLDFEDGQADKLTLDLKYAKTFNKSPGLNQIGFQAPQASINRWKITIKDPGVKVNVRPLVAATETRDGADADNGDSPASGCNRYCIDRLFWFDTSGGNRLDTKE